MQPASAQWLAELACTLTWIDRNNYSLVVYTKQHAVLVQALLLRGLCDLKHTGNQG